MSVRILFFGATADAVGKREVETREYGPASSVLAKLLSDYPRLTSQKLLISINQEHASHESIVRDGDEVAIFTAVSGG